MKSVKNVFEECNEIGSKVDSRKALEQTGAGVAHLEGVICKRKRRE